MSLETISKVSGEYESTGDLVAKYGPMKNGIAQLKIDAAAGRIPQDKALMAKVSIERIAQNNIVPNNMSIYNEQMGLQPPQTPPQMPPQMQQMAAQMPQGGLGAARMARGGMVAFRDGGSVPRFFAGGLNRFITEYDPMGLDDPSALAPMPGETQEEFIERVRRRAAGISSARQAILGPDVAAQKERERLEARQKSLGKEAEEDKWLTGLETAFRILQSGKIGEEAAKGLSQFRAGKQRFRAAEEDIQKGLAGLSGRERAERASALDAALGQEMKLEQQMATGKSQLDVALANAAKTSNQREYAQLYAETLAGTPQGQGKSKQQLLLEGSQDYIKRSTAFDPRMLSAQAAASGVTQRAGATETGRLVNAEKAWENSFGKEKRDYKKAIREGRPADAERIKEEWKQNFARQNPSGASSAANNDPLGLR